MLSFLFYIKYYLLLYITTHQNIINTYSIIPQFLKGIVYTLMNNFKVAVKYRKSPKSNYVKHASWDKTKQIGLSIKK